MERETVSVLATCSPPGLYLCGGAAPRCLYIWWRPSLPVSSRLARLAVEGPPVFNGRGAVVFTAAVSWMGLWVFTWGSVVLDLPCLSTFHRCAAEFAPLGRSSGTTRSPNPTLWLIGA